MITIANSLFIAYPVPDLGFRFIADHGGETMIEHGGELWVFGYGSLIWHPGFDYAGKCLARLPDYRRSFCMTSIHYRGTPERPGLVLALDLEEGAACEGVAYRVGAVNAAATLDYLRERELVSYAYVEAWLPVRLEDGRAVEAVTYVMNREHPQYRGELDLPSQAEVIAHAAGPNGTNWEYLTNTVEGLAALGLRDENLDTLAGLVRQRLGAG
jgi:glutathione-specific gamma-glutamylcyclotransferase